jgi:hypothetical protein
VQGAFGLLHFTMFSLGAHFDTHVTYISLGFQYFSGGGKPRKTEIVYIESVYTGIRLYVYAV